MRGRGEMGMFEAVGSCANVFSRNIEEHDRLAEAQAKGKA